MTDTEPERTVKLIKSVPFSVLHVFNGGTFEDVCEKLISEYEKFKSTIDPDHFITFGFDTKSHDTFAKIWRLETDREYNVRKKRIEHMNGLKLLLHRVYL